MFLIVLLLGVVLIVTLYYKKAFAYWERRDVVTVPSPRFPNGHLRFGSEPMSFYFDKYYKHFREQAQVHGGIYFFTRPVYIPIDLDVIKQLMSIDFESFSNKGLYINEDKRPISAHLFSLGGSRWRKLRTKLTPTFTSGKMKLMFESIIKSVQPLAQSVDKCALSTKEFDIKILSAKFTMDVIGCTVFGLECNSFVDENSDFIKYGQEIVTISPFQALQIPFAFAAPKLAKMLGVAIISGEVEDFYTQVVTETVKYRDANNIKRNDFINLMMELRNIDDSNKRFSLQEIISQSALFFIAGFETSSSTISHALFELAQHQEIQDKVRAEILATIAKDGGELTYDGIGTMKYLQQVIDETLRLHPPLGIINRECTEDCKINGTDTIIEKGTLISIPVYSVQRDPEYYPDPEKFDPDRFSEENIKTRHQYSFLSFGQGPRLCIGQRFGYLQTKIGLATLLSKYKFKIGPNMEMPIRYNAGILLNPCSSILLTCQKI